MERWVKIKVEVGGIKDNVERRLAEDILSFVKNGCEVVHRGDKAYIVMELPERVYLADKEMWERYARRRCINGMKFNVGILERT